MMCTVKLFEFQLSWSKASTKCHDMGMKMLAIETAEEDKAIFDYLGTLGNKIKLRPFIIFQFSKY
jgi:hypothetical protein